MRGSRWRVCSSMLVTAILVTERESSEHLHTLSCYAPTFAAYREKDEFHHTLQQAPYLSTVPECRRRLVESFYLLPNVLESSFHPGF